MSQSSSSSKTPRHHKSSSAWPDSVKIQTKNKKQQRHSRNPFQDLGKGGTNDNGNDSSSNVSSMSSIEAPKGCLRFFYSHTSSSLSSTQTPLVSSSNSNRLGRREKVLSSKTPKSAPNARPAKENLPKGGIFHKPISQKLERVKRNVSRQSGRKPSSRNVQSSKLSSGLDCSGSLDNKLKSGSRAVDGIFDCDGSNLTPFSKVASGLGLYLGVDSKVMNENGDADDEKSKINSNGDTNSTSSNTKTPPVQASVSPEIQGGSSMVSVATKKMTPVCYGAGYIMSGVTDKRKCRPRGILTVGEAKPLDCFDVSDDDEPDQNDTPGLDKSSGVSVLPLPAEASMHWLLSPCNEEDEDQKENSENGSCWFFRLEESAIHNFPASPSSGINVFSPDVCNKSNDRSVSTTSSRRRTRCSSLLSPNGGFMGPPLYDNEAILCSEERKNSHGLHEENSPFFMDSLGSVNAVQTPESDSSSDRGIGLSWLNADGDRKKHNFDWKLKSEALHPKMAGLSPKSHVSMWDPTSLSFQFDCLNTPSNSVDFSQFQKVLDDRALWFSNSTMENVSQSQMRISWREGLVSQICEMDEFDSCRCLSDEEDNANGCIGSCSKSLWGLELDVDVAKKQISTNESGSTKFTDSGHGIDGKAQEKLPPQVPCSCAESISTDGGGLARSEDSDWTICYKNQLFQL